MSDSSTHYKEGWRFSILTKLAQRPHEYKFTWNQTIGNKTRAFVIKQSTIKQAGWGLFADQNFANNDDLVVGEDVDNMYNLEDVMSRFGNKIYLQYDAQPPDYSLEAEENYKQKLISRGVAGASLTMTAASEEDFEEKLEFVLKERWIQRVRAWNRLARASKYDIRELSYNGGVDPYVLQTPIRQTAQRNTWSVDIYDPFNSPLGFLNHPNREEDTNVRYVTYNANNHSDPDPANDTAARIHTLKPVMKGQEFLWNYGSSYDFNPYNVKNHWDTGGKALEHALLGTEMGDTCDVVQLVFTDKLNMKPIKDKIGWDDAVFELKCAWDPFWKLGDWNGLSNQKNVAWTVDGIGQLLNAFRTISDRPGSKKPRAYQHYDNVVRAFFEGAPKNTSLSQINLDMCLRSFVEINGLSLNPIVVVSMTAVLNEENRYVIGCTMNYSHDSDIVAAQLCFYFEQINPPKLAETPTESNFGSASLQETKRQSNLVLGLDLRDYTKDIAAYMEFLRNPTNNFKDDSSWHRVLVNEKMIDRNTYPVDNEGFSYQFVQGKVKRTTNRRHLSNGWLSFRFVEPDGESCYFVTNQNDKWKGNGIRVYVIGSREFEPKHGDLLVQHGVLLEKLQRGLRQGMKIYPHFLNIVSNLEARVWVTLILKGIVDPTPIPAFSKEEFTKRWGREQYERAVLEMAVEHSLVKLGCPVAEDAIYWEFHPNQLARKQKQKRLALKYGWRVGTLEERKRGIPKVVAHQKCPERSEETGEYITHAQFIRSLKPYKKVLKKNNA